MKNIKRKLSDQDITFIREQMKRGSSIATCAKYFKVNKPAILKALGVWNKPEESLNNGLKFHMRRGKVFINEDQKVEAKVQ